MYHIMKVLRPLLLVCGYLSHVEQLSSETDFKLAFHDVRWVTENPEPLNTNNTGMTFK